MTMPIQFNTLQFAKQLTAAGIPPDHAEAHAQALSDVLANTIVVPGDLILLKVDVIARIEVVRQELTASIELVRQELTASIELLRQETLAKFELARHELNALEQRVNGKFKTLHWVLGIMLVFHIATLAKLFSM